MQATTADLASRSNLSYRSRFDVERCRAALVGLVELARNEVEPVTLVEVSETLPPRMQVD